MSLFRTKNIDAMIARHTAGTGLKKVLGPLDLVMLGIGAIIGTGIFVLTGTGALTAGPALTLSFLLAGVACGFAALCYAEFASTIPVSGSIYTYAYSTLGEVVAWIIGWDLILGIWAGHFGCFGGLVRLLPIPAGRVRAGIAPSPDRRSRRGPRG